MFMAKGPKVSLTKSTVSGLKAIQLTEVAAALPFWNVNGPKLRTTTSCVWGRPVQGKPGSSFVKLPEPWASLKLVDCAERT